MKRVGSSTVALKRWGQENPAFRQIFTSQFVPEGTKEQIDWWNEMQRVSASPENAARFMMAVGDIDVTDLLPKVTVPTLVIHARLQKMVNGSFNDGATFDSVTKQIEVGAGRAFGHGHLIIRQQPSAPGH